jgi:hypothetical protein
MGKGRQAVSVAAVAWVTWTGGGHAAPARAATTPAAVADPGSAASLVGYINQERSAAGLTAVAADSDLTTMAVEHSWAMEEADELFHNPDLSSQVQNWLMLGENVGVGSDPADIAAAFMASPEHRQNILCPQFQEVGLGVVDQGGTLWVTEDFSEPAPAEHPQLSPAPAPAASPPAPVTTPPAPAQPVIAQSVVAQPVVARSVVGQAVVGQAVVARRVKAAAPVRPYVTLRPLAAPRVVTAAGKGQSPPPAAPPTSARGSALALVTAPIWPVTTAVTAPRMPATARARAVEAASVRSLQATSISPDRSSSPLRAAATALLVLLAAWTTSRASSALQANRLTGKAA